jgi:hypothetical protein
MIDTYVADYDMFALEGLASSWHSLSEHDRFCCMKGFLVQRNHGGAGAIFHEHRAHFERAGTAAYVELNLARETEGNFATVLARTMQTPFLAHADEFVRSEYAFTIALALLQYNAFEVALEFYQLSIDTLGPSPMYDAYRWRSRFNMALCALKLAHFDTFDRLLEELEDSFKLLRLNAQRYLARLFVWLFLYVNEESRARRLLDALLVAPAQGDPWDYRLSYLSKYDLFLWCKQGKFGEFESRLLQYVPHLSPSDRGVVLRLAETVRTPPRDALEVTRLVVSFTEHHNLLDATLLCDALLRGIALRRDFVLLEQAYKCVELKCLPLRVILPATDLREFGLLAYRALNRSRAFTRLHQAYATSAPPWRRDRLESQLRALGDTRRGVSAILDLDRQELLVDKTAVSLKRKERVQQLLAQVFASGRERVENLGRSFYGRNAPRLHRRRLAALSATLNELVGWPLLTFQGEHLCVAESVRCRVRSRARRDARERHQAILHFAELHREPWAIASLLAELEFPRRTLQADLNDLVTRGELVRTGDRRGARYLRPKFSKPSLRRASFP